MWGGIKRLLQHNGPRRRSNLRLLLKCMSGLPNRYLSHHIVLKEHKIEKQGKTELKTYSVTILQGEDSSLWLLLRCVSGLLSVPT